GRGSRSDPRAARGLTPLYPDVERAAGETERPAQADPVSSRFARSTARGSARSTAGGRTRTLSEPQARRNAPRRQTPFRLASLAQRPGSGSDLGLARDEAAQPVAGLDEDVVGVPLGVAHDRPVGARVRPQE